MQTEGAIRQKLKQVRFRHQKVLIEAHLEPRPCNCRWNRDVAASDEVVGVCLWSLLNPLAEARPPLQVCDERLDGGELARGCTFFEPRKSKEDVKEEFDTFLSSATLGKIAESYPDMAALMWVLTEVAQSTDTPEAPKSESAELDVPPQRPEEVKKSWLRRLVEGELW